MSQPVRTLLFVGLAVASLGLAWGMHQLNQPRALSAFSEVGSEFYPEFTDPLVATGLRVATYDAEKGKSNVFQVEVKDGVWRIPSHHNYPADGKERLARTATSMLGVTRLALVELSKAAHKRYRVVDPLDDTSDSPEGRGDRITLTEGSKVLVDLIVGDKLPGEGDIYYVRQPDRDQVYTADLGKLEVSTKFTDWIQSDLLELDRNDLKQIVVDTYHIDEARGALVPEEQFELTRGDDNKWSLDDLDPAQEQLKESEITATISALDDLKIIGVRPKPTNLRAALKGEKGGRLDLQGELDMQDKGFFFERSTGQILANEGNIIVGTRKGVVYIVKFGEEFSGNEVDLEVGRDKSAQAETSAGGADAEKPAEDAAAGGTRGRYLFVGATFNPELLGPRPEPPVKPEPPAEDAADQEELQKAYEQALKDYELAESVYKDRLKFYEEDLQNGQETVKRLNNRFADWYYVIGDDVYQRLRLQREKIVEAAKPSEPVDPDAAPMPPGAPGVTPEAEVKPEAPPATPEPGAEAKPAEEGKPASETQPAGEAPAPPATAPGDASPEAPAPATPESADSSAGENPADPVNPPSEAADTSESSVSEN
jgi:hypothetical protein